MEAMLGGLPVIVSSATGVKEIVSKIDKRMIVPLDAEKAAAAIVSYFRMSQQKRVALAEMGIKAVKKYQEKTILSAFRKDYKRLLK